MLMALVEKDWKTLLQHSHVMQPFRAKYIIMGAQWGKMGYNFKKIPNEFWVIIIRVGLPGEMKNIDD